MTEYLNKFTNKIGSGTLATGTINLNENQLSEEDFKKLNKTDYDLEGEKDNAKNTLSDAYLNIIEILKKYVDIDKKYLPIISLWIIGTYFHKEFRSFPFLYFNAMKGSGKTRMLNLIITLAKDGEMLNSLTEAVLFRTSGTLAIDEFEGISRKGNENLKELLNSAYKRGTKVKRMRKKKTIEGEEQVVEEFDVYRPIILANIWGMDNVLGDRCISVVLEKSNNKRITRLIELFDEDIITTRTKELLQRESVVWCSKMTLAEVYRNWNKYIIKEDTTNYITTHTYNYTKLHALYKKIKESNIDGRVLELTMPLIIIANSLGGKIVDEVIEIIKSIIEERKVDDIYNNKDVAVLDYLSQEVPNTKFVSITDLTNKFKEFLGESEDWINSKFVGRALNRLRLILKKKRMNKGIYVMLDYLKAQDKMRMFK